MSEIEPRQDGTLIGPNSNAFGSTYDGITIHYASDGAVGIGAGVDPQTLARSAQPAMNEGDQEVVKRVCYGTAGLNALLSVGNMAAAEAVTSTNVGFTAFSLVCAGATYGLSRIIPARERRRQAAVAEVTEKITHIPSSNLSTNIEGMPGHIGIPAGPVPTNELLAVLRDLQTRHLAPEEATAHIARHLQTINPARSSRAALGFYPKQTAGGSCSLSLITSNRLAIYPPALSGTLH